MKWIHITGVCGVITGQLAVAFKKEGYLVTGSDRGFFPPISTHLEENGVNIEVGYKAEHLQANHYLLKYKTEFGKQFEGLRFPDMVVFQGTKGSKNKEYVFAKEQRLKIATATEIITNHCVLEKNSVVVAGSFGKTTTTCILAQIFENSEEFMPSYMFGGLSNNLENGIRLKTNLTNVSVVEGDEYVISLEDKRSKFFEYKPKHVLLTGIKWDHVDIFPTKEKYFDNFQLLLENLGNDGVVVFNADDEELAQMVEHVRNEVEFEVIGYKKDELDLLDGSFDHVIGDYNKMNALGAYKMALALGVDREAALDAIKRYASIKRRLEIRYNSDKKVVIDDFGATPSKAISAIQAVRDFYPKANLTCVFEPNLGSRTHEGIDEYIQLKTLLEKAKAKLILPRFTKVAPEYITSGDLAKYFTDLNYNAVYQYLSDEELVEALETDVQKHKKQTVILFLGSHGFRGMIEQIVRL